MKNENTAKFLSGFAAIVGRPNVGKSTLMNAMVGEKVAIVSNRPQTTRNRIMGVATDKGWQIVFLDTPGLHKPRTRLGEYMVKSVQDAMDGIDVLLVLVDTNEIGPQDRAIVEEMSARKVKKILVLNKTDIVEEARLMAAIQSFAEAGYDAIVPISARTGKGMDELKKLIVSYLPEGPKYFPDDMMTDHPRKGAAASARGGAARHRRGDDGDQQAERQPDRDSRDDLLRAREPQGHHHRQTGRDAAHHRRGGAARYRESAGHEGESPALGQDSRGLAQPHGRPAHAGLREQLTPSGRALRLRTRRGRPVRDENKTILLEKN